MKLPAIVSATWLIDNLYNPNIVILDATLAKPKESVADMPNNDVQIMGARFFDINTAFSDTSVGLPQMMCSPKQFQKEAKKLGINNDSLVIVYDNHGIYSSPRAWWMLKSMGHENVAVLNGGLPKWIQKGFPTEKKESKPQSGDFSPTFKSTCFVNSEFVRNNLNNEDVLILDARSSGRFEGVAPEPREGLRGGHIPNSVNLPFTEVLNRLVLRSQNELKSIFNQFELNDKKIIFTCGSGLTACIILLAAHVAGYEDLTVYDGSWSEWGQKEDLPVHVHG